MTKKLTWEAEKASLVLKVTDGAKETIWKIRKNTDNEVLRQIFEELQLAMWVSGWKMAEEEPWAGMPMRETVRTVDDVELAEIQVDSERASRAAQAARVAQLNIGAKWFEADDDETYGIPIPDYDAGEV